jgi:hypothetical protein
LQPDGACSVLHFPQRGLFDRSIGRIDEHGNANSLGHLDALAEPAVRQRLADLGQQIVPREEQTPAALGAYHKAEIEKWWPIIKAAGIKAE